MARPLYFYNAVIVNEGEVFKGNVLIDGDRIKTVERGEKQLHRNAKEINLEGKYLIPGVIDDQVHFRDPGFPAKGDIHSESRAAVAGGITSYMDMPNTNPKTTTQELLEEKFIMAAEKSLANFSFYMGATNDNLDEVLKTDIKNVCGVKVFMGASTGNMLVDDPEVLEKIFSQSKSLIAVHCEHEPTIQANLKKAVEIFGDAIPMDLHSEIRSEEACYLSSSFAVKLARKHKTRLHVLHLSTEKELELFSNKSDLALKQITCEVCVHHLSFSQEDYKELGSKIKWNPSIKSKSDRNALILGLHNDFIDVVATDHAPHTKAEKNHPYLQSPSGGPLVQHSLVAMLELFHKKYLSIEEIVTKMCHAPAICFKVKHRGFIREGYYADLCVVDLDSPWEVNQSNLLYKVKWSPFEGKTFKSKVLKTIVNGKLVYNNGEFDESVRGMRLEFNRRNRD